MPETFVRRSSLPVSSEEAFQWHARPGAFERLTPPWQRVEVIARRGDIREGDQTELRMWAGGIPLRWLAEHRDYRPGEQFVDVQLAGPFRSWRHTHRFEPDGEHACQLEDRIEFELPGGRSASVLAAGAMRRKLASVFAYRHRITAQDLAMHATTRVPPMNVLVSGSTGLVGSALIPLLTSGGHRVQRLVRAGRDTSPENVTWNPETGELDAGKLTGIDAVVHLAGEPIASGRWTAAKKARIRDSRVVGTRNLCQALASMDTPPKTLVSASAIGFYGDRGDEVLNEQSAGGSGFLADVCREWEAATAAAEAAGIRVVHMRFGVILTPAGGALAKMLLPFKLGVGGVLGSGRQWMSWISLDDVLGAIHHTLATGSLVGPVNFVAPAAVTNREFTKTLGRVLSRPTVLPAPGFAMKLALGEMADELLLASQRVEPKRLSKSNYVFRFDALEAALRHLLGKDA